METLTEKCSSAWHELWLVFLRISDAVESAIRRRIRAQAKPRAIDVLSEIRQAAYMKVSDCQTIDSIVYSRLSMPLINNRITIVEPLKTALRRGA